MFDITKYLGDPRRTIGTTVVVYACPCCNKDLKVNVAIPSKPYKCWSTGCSNEDIRKALRLGLTTIKRDNNPKPQSYNISPLHLEGLEIPFKAPNYTAPYSFKHGEWNSKPAIITTYYYSDSCNVQRIDYLDGSRKEFFPSYINSDGKRQYGSTLLFPLFNTRFLTDLKYQPLLYIVEGEKCAITFTQELGLLAVSPPGFGWNEKYLKLKLQDLACRISGLKIIPDNDVSGRNKSSLLRTVAWQCGIKCEIINNLPYTEEKEDIADLLNKNINVGKYL